MFNVKILSTNNNSYIQVDLVKAGLAVNLKSEENT